MDNRRLRVTFSPDNWKYIGSLMSENVAMNPTITVSDIINKVLDKAREGCSHECRCKKSR